MGSFEWRYPAPVLLRWQWRSRVPAAPFSTIWGRYSIFATKIGTELSQYATSKESDAITWKTHKWVICPTKVRLLDSVGVLVKTASRNVFVERYLQRLKRISVHSDKRILAEFPFTPICTGMKIWLWRIVLFFFVFFFTVDHSSSIM